MKNKFVKYILSVAVASCMTGCFDLDHEEFYNIDADGSQNRRRNWMHLL